MAVSPRLIKRRIRSVSNTRKITKAMELVAASKMRKAVQLTQASREYSRSISEIVTNVRTLVDPATHPLLAGRQTAKTSLLIVASSDRGLCGGFNAQVLKKTLEFLNTRTESLRVVTVGKRAQMAVKRTGHPIIASFDAISNTPSFEGSRPAGNLAYKEFMDGTVDRVFMVYTDFKSALSQIPTVAQLLPIIPESELVARSSSDEVQDESSHELHATNILFEPSSRQLLDRLLPRLLETQIYQALLESSASEHSARMMAMRSATDNASNMIDDLTLTFNQARQANITREISEISAGKAAIE